MGSTTKQATSKSTSEPWKEQAPYIKETMSEAQKLYNAPGPSYFPGSTVAGFSPEQQQAQQMGIQRATQGNAGMDMAEGYNKDILSGKYLEDPNDGMMFNNIMQKVIPGVNSQFMGSGRSGSGLHADTATRALTESYAPYATQMRQYGLGQMDAAANRSSMFAQNDYNDINALGAIGQQKQDLAQNDIHAAGNRFNLYQDRRFLWNFFRDDSSRADLSEVTHTAQQAQRHTRSPTGAACHFCNAICLGFHFQHPRGAGDNGLHRGQIIIVQAVDCAKTCAQWSGD